MEEIKKLEYAKKFCFGLGSAMVVLPLLALLLSVVDKCIGRTCSLNSTALLVGGTIFALGIVLVLAGFLAGKIIKEKGGN